MAVEAIAIVLQADDGGIHRPDSPSAARLLKNLRTDTGGAVRESSPEIRWTFDPTTPGYS